jgi:hypothetical protein
MANGWLFPAIVTVIIICVIAYFFPTQFSGFTKWGGDNIKSIVGGVTDQKCPSTQDVVCGTMADGTKVSYQNGCYAQKAKVNYTQGACTVS